jgi:hypothetical protein
MKLDFGKFIPIENDIDNAKFECPIHDLELGYDAGSASYSEIEPYFCVKTGKIIIPDEDWDGNNTNGIALPHMYELNLGNRLVERFINMLPDKEANEVERSFRGRGAYSKMKSTLDQLGLLESWFFYSEYKTICALVEWANSEDILITDLDAANKRLKQQMEHCQ